MLLIERSRILKQARGKVAAALRVLTQEFASDDRWLVYCDDTTQLDAAVTGALALGLPVMEFHSAMKGDRAAVLRSLSAHGGVVVAIRCLDEGVDLPSCDHALILASSTVDREYIQRRGRVLRSAPEKVMATVHDLLLVNGSGGVLARSEAMRALEFARLSRNPGARAHLQLLIALSPDLAQVTGLYLGDDDEEEADS
jgi:superfamily II DNA or RNA helicase